MSVSTVEVDEAVVRSAEVVARRLLLEAERGAVELLACPHLLEELGQVLRRKKFRRHLSVDAADQFVEAVRLLALEVPNPRRRRRPARPEILTTTTA